jgi:hypothetical protein
MNRCFALLLMCGLYAGANSPIMAQSIGSSVGKPGPSGFGWKSSWEEGKDLARKLGKPLMVVLRCDP